MFGFRRSNLDFRFLPNNRSAGLCHVVACGAVRYANRNLSSLCWIDRSDLLASTAFLKLNHAFRQAGWMIRSASHVSNTSNFCKTFEFSRYDRGVHCPTQLALHKPILANKDRGVATVSAAVVFRILNMSNHLMYASTTTKNILP